MMVFLQGFMAVSLSVMAWAYIYYIWKLRDATKYGEELEEWMAEIQENTTDRLNAIQDDNEAHWTVMDATFREALQKMTSEDFENMKKEN